ncbi:VOC family protein [Nocardioides sp. MAHUQ-72]|uniref:VOC family protein n=1 Tax=unclassified Nocardioides TaxID=2615069 RepID=UPI003607094C
MTTLPGEPCWIELFTPDTDAAADFYGGLFGWTATEPDEELGGYRIFERDGVPVAGLMRNDGSMGGPSTWTVYLASTDATALLDRARAAGAEVIAGPMQVGDLGTMGVLVDPAGAAVGVWQAQSFPGTGVRAQDGAPAWFETLTKDYDAAVRFYADVFGWDTHTMSDTPEFRYTTLGTDEQARAGIMDATAMLGEDPSRWQFYLQVADTDATVERAEAGGATVVVPAEDTPYGRLAVLRDPAGVQFCLMGPTPQG